MLIFGTPDPEKPVVRVCSNCKAFQPANKTCSICRCPPVNYVTLKEYFMGRDTAPNYASECTEIIKENAVQLLQRINCLFTELSSYMPGFVRPPVNSGWRPAAINSTVPNAAKSSRHIIAKACDFKDEKQKLSKFLMNNQNLLEKYDLAIEHPDATPTWCHIQHGTPKSGRRVFYP